VIEQSIWYCDENAAMFILSIDFKVT
jgi:hypothetical protein